MASSLAEQLRPLIREWARQVAADAADLVFDATQALCPEDEGTLKASGSVEPRGELSFTISYDDVGFTDEGPTAHPIEGNPLLAFDWPEQGLYPAVFRHVEWVPGPGVEANKGWFTERACTQEQWENALRVAAEGVAL